MAATLFGFFGLGLACLGIYSVMNYSVSRRLREIGLRMAVGAQSRDVARLILVEAGRLIGLGILLGMLAALLLGRWLASLLYGVSAQDPRVYVTVALLLSLVGMGAAWLPARRAGRIDPKIALRQE